MVEIAAYQSIPVEQIRSAAHQARKTFDEHSIKALAESIKLEGLLQPITVRQVGNDYELISGERRLRACKLNGMAAIEAKVIQTVSEAEAAAKGLMENLQREDLNPIEEAEDIQAMLDLKDSHWTQEQIGKVLGKKQSEISETLRLLKLSDSIKANIRRLIISAGHASALLRLPTAELQDKVASQIEKNDLSVKQTREVINKILAKPNGKDAPSNKPSTGLKKDPLAARWKELKTDFGIEASGAWGVAFKKGKWIFTVDSAGVGTSDALATWFRQIAEALGRAAPAPSDDSDSTDVPETIDETAGVTAMQKRANLPKTAEEEAELYALAAKSKGPGPIYAKLYGPLNPLTQLGETMKWADFQVTDPKEGLHQLLDAIRKAKDK